MTFQLDKINPKFRQLVDLLFYSDRIDLDLTDFKHLLKQNYEDHFEYLQNRFAKSSEIFWENGERFWSHRLSFLLSLNDKALTKYVEEYLQKRMVHVVKFKPTIDVRYDVEYLQFLELCKIKHAKKESLSFVKNFLTDMPSHLSVEKLTYIIKSFIPIVFTDFNEYTEAIIKKITNSARNFDLLLALEKQGVEFDKVPIVNLARDIILERTHNEKNCRAFFNIIREPSFRSQLKSQYNSSYKTKLLHLLESCDYQLIEEHHLINIKNIIDLDASVADELAIIYADKLYARHSGHKKANADRLIRLLKQVNQISSKKILAYLSANNKMSDIKYVLSSFPELRKLAAFV
jgi:hypothetical protein